MGFFDFFTGETEFVQTAKAPDAPLQGLTGLVESRLGQVMRDPARSQEFRTRQAALRDAESVRSSDVGRRVTESLGGSLAQGARFKVTEAARSQIRQETVQAERAALDEVITRSNQTFLNLLNTLSQFRASTFASEVQSVRAKETPGFFDFVTGAAGAAQAVTGTLFGTDAVQSAGLSAFRG